MWTPEMNSKLLQLWPNYSASQIATKLGVTRNAVIGRLPIAESERAA